MSQQETRNELIRLIPRLRRFAMVLTGSAADADDLVQDALERGLTRLHQWRPGTRLDSWMFRIAHTVRLNQLRDNRSGAYRDIADFEHELGVDEAPRIEARLTLQAVRREVARLPEPQRIVLVLVCVEGFKYREAAEILEIPVGTVMSRLARARLTLATVLGEFDGTADAAGEADSDTGTPRRGGSLRLID